MLRFGLASRLAGSLELAQDDRGLVLADIGASYGGLCLCVKAVAGAAPSTLALRTLLQQALYAISCLRGGMHARF
jgi:hypothetical protein